METICILLAILGVYRLSRDLVYEDGPFELYAKIQAWAEWIPEDNQKRSWNWLRNGLVCPICLSFWFALLAACVLTPPTWQLFLLTWFGVAGGALFFIKLTG